MPIYEYHCDGCGHEFEEMQKVSDAHVARCERCGADKAHRLISRSSFQLKGGGWYADLYGSKGSGGSSKSSSPAKSASTATSTPTSTTGASSASTASSSTASSKS